jgi:hypothetical protein
MNAVISPQKEFSEADQQYRRLAALDSRRPGEWVRRKVLAYAAQQAAERALRESAEGRGNSVPVVPAAAAARKVTPAVAAVKKPLIKPLVLIATFGTLAVVALVGFFVVPSLMAPHITPPPPASVPLPVVGRAPVPTSAPSSYGTASAAPSSASDSSELPPLPAAAAAPRVSAPTVAARAPAPPRSPASPATSRRLAVSAARARAATLRANNSTASRRKQSSPATGTQDLAGSAAPATEAPSATQPALPPTPPAVVSAPVPPPEGFWRAARNGDVKGVQGALANNVDVNALDAKGHRALILAIAYGQVDIVRALLAHGANPSLADAHGTTPLGAAHTRGNFEILKALERSGSH